MPICEHCGTDSPDGFRYCPACGSALPKAAPVRQTRKVVTALFCDVTGSTALGEELDPEVLRGVMNRYFAEIRATIERHGGTVEKFIGDAVMAVFGIPRVHEDDALRAVRAAAEIRERLPAVALRGRGGAAVPHRRQHRAGVSSARARIWRSAMRSTSRRGWSRRRQPGEILLGRETLALGARRGRGRGARAAVAEGQVRARAGVPAGARRSGRARRCTPFGCAAGRPRARAARAASGVGSRGRRSPRCHLFTLLGAAGVGKSRLVAELLLPTWPTARRCCAAGACTTARGSRSGRWSRR